MISVKFLLVISLLCKSEWSWELRTWSHKMNVTDASTNSPHYFFWKHIGITNENLNFDVRVSRVYKARTVFFDGAINVSCSFRYCLGRCQKMPWLTRENLYLFSSRLRSRHQHLGHWVLLYWRLQGNFTSRKETSYSSDSGVWLTRPQSCRH